jgi:hypothetical protein
MSAYLVPDLGILRSYTEDCHRRARVNPTDFFYECSGEGCITLKVL